MATMRNTTEDNDRQVHFEELYRQLLPFLKKAERDSSWRDEAACKSVGPSEFFGGAQTRKTKSMCSICVVSKQCLQFALDNDIRDGIWGGYNSKERRSMLA